MDEQLPVDRAGTGGASGRESGIPVNRQKLYRELTRQRLRKYLKMIENRQERQGALNSIDFVELLLKVTSNAKGRVVLEDLILDQLPEWRRARETGVLPHSNEIGGLANSYHPEQAGIAAAETPTATR